MPDDAKMDEGKFDRDLHRGHMDTDSRKVARFAVEALWVQQQIIFDLLNAVHALENLLRRDHPHVFSQYDELKTAVTSQSYSAQRSTIEEIEKVVEFARKIAA
jgi:hypothetical protein